MNTFIFLCKSLNSPIGCVIAVEVEPPQSSKTAVQYFNSYILCPEKFDKVQIKLSFIISFYAFSFTVPLLRRFE